MPSPSAIKAGKAFILIEAVDKTGGILKKAERRLKRFANRMSSIGRKMLRQSIIGVVATGFMVRTFVRFDDVMKKVEARTVGTTKELKLLRKQAQGLADDLGFKPFQIAEIQANLGQKGFTREQILGTTENIANLARATGGGSPESIGLASDLVGGAILQFADLDNTFESTARIADVFTVAVNNSNVQLDSLKEGMKGIGPLADQFGLSLERTVALLGVLGDAMLGGSRSGITLKNVFTNVSKEAKDFNEDLEKLTGKRIDFISDKGDLIDLPSLLESLRIATEGLGTAQRSVLLGDLLSKRAIIGAAAAGTEKGINKFNKLIDLMEKGGGAAKKTAEIMNSGLGGALRRLSARFDNLQIAVGEALVKTLSDFITKVEDIIVKLTAWVEANQELVVQIVGAIVGVGLLGIAMIVLAGVITAVATVLGVVGTLLGVIVSVLTLMASHAILTTVALAGLAATLFSMPDLMARVVKSIVDLGKHFEELLETVNKTWKGITDAISGGDMQLALKIAFLGIEIAWMETITSLTNAWNEMLDNLLTGLKGLGTALSDVLLVEYVIFIHNMADGIGVAAINVTESLQLMLFDTLRSIGDAFTKVLRDAFELLLDALRLLPGGEHIAEFVDAGALDRLDAAEEKGDALRQSIIDDAEDARVEIGKKIIAREEELRGGLVAKRRPEKQAKEAEEARQKQDRDKILKGKKAELNVLTQRAALLKLFANVEKQGQKNLEALDKAIADIETGRVAKVKKTTQSFVSGGGLSSAKDFVPSQIIRGLEKGSVTAAEQAQKNRANNQIFNKILSKETEAVEEIKKVEKAILDLVKHLTFGVI